MSVVLIVAILWIALSICLAFVLSRAVRVAEARKRDGEVSLSNGSLPEECSSRFVDPPVGAGWGLSRQ